MGVMIIQQNLAVCNYSTGKAYSQIIIWSAFVPVIVKGIVNPYQK